MDQRADLWAYGVSAYELLTMKKPFPVQGFNISVGVSIGIALGSRSGSSAAELIKSADLALYRAKRDGGSGLVES